MAYLKEKDREYIKEAFKSLKDEVKLIYFTQEFECQFCRETRQILDEVAELSDKISMQIYNFVTDKTLAEHYGIDKIPATVIEGERDFGIRFYGIPSGYEFSTLIEDIIDVSKSDSGLSDDSRNLLKSIKTPLKLQVFVTPTCPYCPSAVRLAHKIAIENEHITAEMVEATEFPHLAMRHNVRGVPRTIVGEDFPMEGTMQEKIFIEKITDYVSKSIY